MYIDIRYVKCVHMYMCACVCVSHVASSAGIRSVGGCVDSSGSAIIVIDGL